MTNPGSRTLRRCGVWAAAAALLGSGGALLTLPSTGVAAAELASGLTHAPAPPERGDALTQRLSFLTLGGLRALTAELLTTDAASGKEAAVADKLVAKQPAFEEDSFAWARVICPAISDVPTDDESTGMDTCRTHSTLKHLCILDGIRLTWVSTRLCLLQFRCTLKIIGKLRLHSIRKAVWHSLTQSITPLQWQFLHSGNILDGVLCRHRTIGDDMCTILLAIFLHNPLQNLTSTVIVEVGIYIRQ